MQIHGSTGITVLDPKSFAIRNGPKLAQIVKRRDGCLEHEAVQRTPASDNRGGPTFRIRALLNDRALNAVDDVISVADVESRNSLILQSQCVNLPRGEIRYKQLLVPQSVLGEKRNPA